jgi:hypothetical protein
LIADESDLETGRRRVLNTERKPGGSGSNY